MDDLASLTDLWVDLVEGQRSYGTHLRAESNRSTARDFLARYVTDDRVFVARGPFDPVGFVMFHVSSGVYDQDVTRGIVDNVYVRPDYRNEGVGTALLDAAENALADAGVDAIAISVLAANDGARRLYERRGYRTHRVELERQVETKTDTHSREAGQ